MTRKEYVRRKLNEKRVSWIDIFINSVYSKEMPQNYLKDNSKVMQKIGDKNSEKVG